MGARLYGLAVLFAASGAAVTVAALADAAPAGGVTLLVEETAGLRRFGYPVSATVALPRGAVAGPEQLALEDESAVLRGVQYNGGQRWPDGSLREVTLAFNLSPGPREQQRLRLVWGPGVSHPDPGTEVVEETPDAFLIRGTYRVDRKGPGFLTSLRYGPREFLAGPARWDAGFMLPEIPGSRESRVLSRGPVNAVVEITGRLQAQDGEVPYRMTVSQPNSKSWFDCQIRLTDPESRVEQLRLTVPFAFEKDPLHFDFGVGSWVYGTLRRRQTALLEAEGSRSWRIVTGEGDTSVARYAEAAPGQPRAEGWGHLIDGEPGGRAVGFGTPDLGSRSGPSCSLGVSGSGEVTLTWRWRKGAPREARALFHQVADPIQVTAVTSPASMLTALRVKVVR